MASAADVAELAGQDGEPAPPPFRRLAAITFGGDGEGPGVVVAENPRMQISPQLIGDSVLSEMATLDRQAASASSETLSA